MTVKTYDVALAHQVDTDRKIYDMVYSSRFDYIETWEPYFKIIVNHINIHDAVASCTNIAYRL